MGEQIPSVIEPCARWTDDSQGKKDFDGRLLSISTRYWPGEASGHGMMVVETSKVSVDVGAVRSVPKISIAPYGKMPSAVASICVNFGKPDQYGHGDYATLLRQEFEAHTEAQVQAQVEAWVKEACNMIVQTLRRSLAQNQQPVA